MSTTTIDMSIDGMHCDQCVRAVTEALQRVPGVSDVEVRVGGARVRFDQTQTELPKLIEAVRGAGGFEVSGFTGT